MKKNIYLMYAMSFLQGMVFYSSIATLYRQVWGVTMFQIMAIESICLIVSLVLEIPWGLAADKIGYRNTMILCSLLYALSKVIFWRATGFGWFLAERLLLGVVSAGLSGVDSSILYLSCKQEESQKVFGIYSALGTAGMILATLIYAGFVRENYRMAALLTVLSYSAAAVLPFFLTEVKGAEETCFSWQDTFAAIGKTFRSPMILLFLFASALLSETQWAVAVFLNQLQYERCGLSVTAIGLIFAVATLAELTSGLSDRFTKWMGEKSALLVLSGASAFACFLLAVTCNPWISIACVLLIELAWSLWNPLFMALENRQVHTKNRATMLSIFAMISNGVAFGADLVFGALADKGLSYAFLFGGVICTLGAGLLMVWYKVSRKTN